jgi:type I restriction enzyme S subunit
VRLLRGSNVKRGVTDWAEGGTQFWPVVTSDIQRYLLKPGDVVVAMDGSLVGRSFARMSLGDVPALLLQRVARLRSGIINQEFLGVCVCSQRFTDHCDSVKTVTAIPHISPGDIRSFKIALPPTSYEQEAIAKVMSDMDTELTSLEFKLTKARDIKQGMMQELLTGRIRLI